MIHTNAAASAGRILTVDLDDNEVTGNVTSNGTRHSVREHGR